MSVKVGVIGLGFMGSAHARVYTKLKGCELVAICDSNPELKTLAKTYNCKFFTNSQDFFSEKIDAISVCTPTSMHEETTIEAIDHGLHVLVEKPFAECVSSGEMMIKKANTMDCLLAVGYIERFNSAVTKLKKIIKDSQIFSTVSTRFGPFPPRTRYSGVFLDLASHEIDILNFLTQTEPQILYSHFSSKSENSFEDYAYISLKYDKMHSHIEASWLPDYKLRVINLYANDRYYVLNYALQQLKEFRGPPKAKIENGNWNDILWLSRHVEKEISISPSEPLFKELQCFVDSVKINEVLQPLCTPSDAIRVLRISDNVFKRMQLQKD